MPLVTFLLWLFLSLSFFFMTFQVSLFVSSVSLSPLAFLRRTSCVSVFAVSLAESLLFSDSEHAILVRMHPTSTPATTPTHNCITVWTLYVGIVTNFARRTKLFSSLRATHLALSLSLSPAPDKTTDFQRQRPHIKVWKLKHKTLICKVFLKLVQLRYFFSYAYIPTKHIRGVKKVHKSVFF